MTYTLSPSTREELQEVNQTLCDVVPVVFRSEKRDLLVDEVDELLHTWVVLLDAPQSTVGRITDVVETDDTRSFVIDTGADVSSHGWESLRTTNDSEIQAAITGENPSTLDEHGHHSKSDQPHPDVSSDQDRPERETRLIQPTINGDPVPDIIFSLLDGSTFVVDEPIVGKAILVASGEEFEAVVTGLQHRIAEKYITEGYGPSPANEICSDEHTVIQSETTGDREPSIKTHAHIAYSVIYETFRPQILSITLSSLQTKDSDSDSWETNDMTVVGLGDDITYYCGEGSITVPLPEKSD